MKDFIQPHDKFFKLVFKRGETTAEFIENNLPPEIVSLIDLESLEYEKDTFIDERFKDHFSDLLINIHSQRRARGQYQLRGRHFGRGTKFCKERRYFYAHRG